MATQSVRIGWRPYVSQVVNAVDADATAFIAAAGITDLTQAAAITTLVNDLKTYGLWSKMKALYPFVGGTATSHKFNLKDPRDLDAAYRLVFSGGWVHSSTGALPNGSNGYADTKLRPSSQQSATSGHFSLYSRTSGASLTQYGSQGIYNTATDCSYLIIRRVNDNYIGGAMWSENNSSGAFTITSTPDGRGYYMVTRIANNNLSFYKNGTLIVSNTSSQNSPTLSVNSYYLGANNHNGNPDAHDNKETTFASIGDGLTSTETSLLYNVVQKFQTILGRHVGTPYVSDADAVSFLTTAGITDSTQAVAINTLVTDLKAANIWTKMKAIYPFVGGTATSHKFNLKDPRDLDVAYRLVFSGGWVHSSTGASPNGTTGYANTFLNPFNNLSIDSTHMSYYSRINNNRDSYDMGVTTTNTGVNLSLTTALKWGDSFTYYSIGFNPTEVSTLLTSSARNFIFNKISPTSTSMFENNVKYTFSVTNRTLPNGNFYLGARNLSGVANSFSNRETAFTSIGDGLTDTEVATFYAAIQKYQTTLGRQVNTPVVSDSDAQTFLNAAGITSYTQANAVNTLVVDLKAAGVWSKMKALYPFVGGTATTHKFNLKDPRDVDAAYRLVFNGGWTHTGTGALPNGTTGYANTYLNPYTNLSNNNTHDSIYINNNISSYTYWPGFGVMSSATSAFYTHIKTNGNYYSYIGLEQATQNGIIYSNDSNHGFYINSRISSTSLKGYKNGITKNSTSVLNTGSLPSNHYYYGVRNMDSATYNNYSHSFASIGDGLTDTESTAFYTAVQKFQTSLGRQVGTPVYNTNGLVLNLDAGVANSYPGTGTTWFDLAAGNNGTLVNGPTYDINNGGSLSFDGVNDYVVVSDTPFRFGNQFTINTWIYWDGLDKTNRGILGKRNGPSGNYNQYAMGINNGDVQYGGTGKVLFFYARVDGSTGGNDPLDVSMTYTLPSTPGIYNISVVMDSTIQKMFVNGLLVSTSTKNVSGRTYNISGVDFLVGANRDNTGTGALGFFNNKIYSVSVYGRTLTDVEVLQNFNSSRGRFGV